jgi:hypothetical protein
MGVVVKHITVLAVAIGFIFALTLLTDNSIAAQDEGEAHTAGWSPFQVSIYNPIQLFDEHKDIIGLRLSFLYGKNADIFGIDLGLGVNGSDNVTGIQIAGIYNLYNNYPSYNIREPSTVKGIQIAGLENTTNNLYGIQIGGFRNGVTDGAAGIQIALYENRARTMKGIQIALVGNTASTIKGIQIAGFFNDNLASNVTGIQIGAINMADSMTGVQIGLINVCKHLTGIQIGLINNIEQGRFPYLPIVNAQF